MEITGVELARLFDCYGGLLTEKQRMIFELYHNDDLSLGEIAENLEISRQGVRDALVRAESALAFFEEKIGRVALEKELSSVRRSLNDMAEELSTSYSLRSDPQRLKQMGRRLSELSARLGEI